MATPDSLERAAEPAQATAVAQATTVEPSSNIWADDRGCRSKIKSRRALIASAVTLCAALALILFLVVPKSSNHSSEDISAQSYDVNSLGCFVDERHDRVMPYVYSDPISMTPAVSTSMKINTSMVGESSTSSAAFGKTLSLALRKNNLIKKSFFEKFDDHFKLVQNSMFTVL